MMGALFRFSWKLFQKLFTIHWQPYYSYYSRPCLPNISWPGMLLGSKTLPKYVDVMRARTPTSKWNNYSKKSHQECALFQCVSISLRGQRGRSVFSCLFGGEKSHVRSPPFNPTASKNCSWRTVHIQVPIASMYGIFTYIYHLKKTNVGKYTIHGSYMSYPMIPFRLFESGAYQRGSARLTMGGSTCFFWLGGWKRDDENHRSIWGNGMCNNKGRPEINWNYGYQGVYPYYHPLTLGKTGCGKKTYHVACGHQKEYDPTCWTCSMPRFKLQQHTNIRENPTWQRKKQTFEMYLLLEIVIFPLSC